MVARAQALHDYMGEEDVEDAQFLLFEQGAIVDVLEQDESGWWEGMVDGQIGIFPGGFVEVFELIDEDGNVTPVEPGEYDEEEGVLEEGEELPAEAYAGEDQSELVAQLQTEIDNLKYELEDAQKMAQQASAGGDEAGRLAQENSELQQQLAAAEADKADVFSQLTEAQR